MKEQKKRIESAKKREERDKKIEEGERNLSSQPEKTHTSED
jgi:hypothetical protein